MFKRILRLINGRYTEEIVGVVPPGGLEGQTLVKTTPDNYDYIWDDPGGFMAFYVPPNKQYKITKNSQALIAMTVKIDGIVKNDGIIIELR